MRTCCGCSERDQDRRAQSQRRQGPETHVLALRTESYEKSNARSRTARDYLRRITSGDSGGALRRVREELRTPFLNVRGLVLAPAFAQELSERLQRLVDDLAEIGAGNGVDRLAEELLSLVVSALRGSNHGERGSGCRPGRDVLRTDGLACVEGVALCFIDSTALEEQLCEAALALAQRGPVAQRLQQPDRLAEALLGL